MVLMMMLLALVMASVMELATLVTLVMELAMS